MRLRYLIIFLILVTSTAGAASERLVWPPAPDQPRVEYVGEILCSDLKIKTGFLGKIKRFIGGREESETLALPFDLVASGDRIYMTCQNIPYLIEIDRNNWNFKMYSCDKQPLLYPIAVCAGAGETIYVTDSEVGVVYRLHDGRLELFINSHLTRPTGIAALPDKSRLYVVDTGDHTVKIFDLSGEFIRSVPDTAASISLHFPTFAAATKSDEIVLNDALNFTVKRFDAEGTFLSQFGSEGDGPGTFSRPKGVAVDSESHIYVVDNLFDNIQVFDETGQLLLVIGARGRQPGQFWSPAGIDIADDTVYIADTYNNRIQILHYMGEKR